MREEVRIFWTRGGSARLKKLPWENLVNSDIKISHERLDSGAFPFGALVESAKGALTLYVGDFDEKEDLASIKRSEIEKLPEGIIIFLLVPSDLLDKASTLLDGIKDVYLLQKPVQSSALIILIEKVITSEEYKRKLSRAQTEEIQWLQRIENIFELSRQEALYLEASNQAYEQLVDFEAELLEEQKRINRALLNLEEYRDSVKKEEAKEKQALDALTALMQSELKDKTDSLKAMENLLNYSSLEKKALEKIMAEINLTDNCDKKQVVSILQRHAQLLEEIKRLCSSKN